MFVSKSYSISCLFHAQSSHTQCGYLKAIGLQETNNSNTTKVMRQWQAMFLFIRHLSIFISKNAQKHQKINQQEITQIAAAS